MTKLSSTLIASAFAAALVVVPAMAADGKPGGGSGGGQAIHSGGGGGGGGVKSGGGGGGGVKSSGGQKSFSSKAPSSGNVVRSHRSSGGSAKVFVPSQTHVQKHVGSGNRSHHRGTRYLWGGLPFYFYDGYYHGDCGWLRRRAEATGSRYWWIRYRQCREDD